MCPVARDGSSSPSSAEDEMMDIGKFLVCRVMQLSDWKEREKLILAYFRPRLTVDTPSDVVELVVAIIRACPTREVVIHITGQSCIAELLKKHHSTFDFNDILSCFSHYIGQLPQAERSECILSAMPYPDTAHTCSSSVDPRVLIAIMSIEPVSIEVIEAICSNEMFACALSGGLGGDDDLSDDSSDVIQLFKPLLLAAPRRELLAVVQSLVELETKRELLQRMQVQCKSAKTIRALCRLKARIDITKMLDNIYPFGCIPLEKAVEGWNVYTVKPIVFSRSDSVKAFLVKYYLGYVLDFKPIDQRLCLSYRQICVLAGLIFEYAQAQHINQVSQDQQALLGNYEQRIWALREQIDHLRLALMGMRIEENDPSVFNCEDFPHQTDRDGEMAETVFDLIACSDNFMRPDLERVEAVVQIIDSRPELDSLMMSLEDDLCSIQPTHRSEFAHYLHGIAYMGLIGNSDNINLAKAERHLMSVSGLCNTLFSKAKRRLCELYWSEKNEASYDLHSRIYLLYNLWCLITQGDSMSTMKIHYNCSLFESILFDIQRYIFLGYGHILMFRHINTFFEQCGHTFFSQRQRFMSQTTVGADHECQIIRHLFRRSVPELRGVNVVVREECAVDKVSYDGMTDDERSVVNRIMREEGPPNLDCVLDFLCKPVRAAELQRSARKSAAAEKSGVSSPDMPAFIDIPRANNI